MTSFGVRGFDDDGLPVHYKNSKADSNVGTNSSFDVLGEISALIYDWLGLHHPEILSQIRKDNSSYGDTAPRYAKSGKYIAPRIIISNKLGNEGHCDVFDEGISIVIWVYENHAVGESTDDWRFVLPSLRTGDGKEKRDGVSIPIYHGLVLIYDGRVIRHATSIPLGSRGNKYGIFHGSNTAQKIV